MVDEGLKCYLGDIVFDGGVTNFCPTFKTGTDDRRTKQLVFNLGDVDYPPELLVFPNDLCIETLVLRGA